MMPAATRAQRARTRRRSVKHALDLAPAPPATPPAVYRNMATSARRAGHRTSMVAKKCAARVSVTPIAARTLRVSSNQTKRGSAESAKSAFSVPWIHKMPRWPRPLQAAKKIAAPPSAGVAFTVARDLRQHAPADHMYPAGNRARKSGDGTTHAACSPNQRLRRFATNPYTISRSGRGTSVATRPRSRNAIPRCGARRIAAVDRTEIRGVGLR
jgi:hypothetical protein